MKILLVYIDFTLLKRMKNAVHDKVKSLCAENTEGFLIV